jgi:hypothetical protein
MSKNVEYYLEYTNLPIMVNFYIKWWTPKLFNVTEENYSKLKASPGKVLWLEGKI